jgi:hypothetical protein
VLSTGLIFILVGLDKLTGLDLLAWLKQWMSQKLPSNKTEKK